MSKESIDARSIEIRAAKVRRNNLKSIVVANLTTVRHDCDNWEDWDTNDRHNFESMSGYIQDAITFIKKE